MTAVSYGGSRCCAAPEEPLWETPEQWPPGSRAPASRLAALSSSPIALLSAPPPPPPPGHPGADDPLRVVPEARQKAERTPSFSGLLGRATPPAAATGRG